jgi:hypothetical protein
VLTDAILDVLSAPGNWLIGLLPAATFTPDAAVGSGYADPSLTLAWVQTQGSSVLTGGPGFIFNGELLAAMLTSMLAVELAIFSVRGIVWIKKAILV